MLHGVATRGTMIVAGVNPPYSGALPQSTDTTAPAGVDRTGIFSVVSFTIVAQRAAATTTAAASKARFMTEYSTPIGAPAARRLDRRRLGGAFRGRLRLPTHASRFLRAKCHDNSSPIPTTFALASAHAATCRIGRSKVRHTQ